MSDDVQYNMSRYDCATAEGGHPYEKAYLTNINGRPYHAKHCPRCGHHWLRMLDGQP